MYVQYNTFDMYILLRYYYIRFLNKAPITAEWLKLPPHLLIKSRRYACNDGAISARFQKPPQNLSIVLEPPHLDE